nr:hypothetical protein [Salinihabitans flavidus]
MIRLALPLLLLLAAPALADPPVVEGAEAGRSSESWRVSVTLSHPDTGWNHYADGWRVLDENGTELGRRVLHHPHVDEQPFTRSLSGLDLPEGSGAIWIEPRCSVDGWSGTRTRVDLP